MKNNDLIHFDAFFELLKAISCKQNPGFTYFYRGCSTVNYFYNLTPTVYRDFNVEKEHIFYKECILQNPQIFQNEKSTLEKLVIMQHHFYPTRLLDITTNPLVALYFACLNYKSHEPKDGVLYMFRVPNDDIKYFDSDTVSLVSNLSKLNIEKFESNFRWEYLIHEIREEKSYFRGDLLALNKDSITKVYPVKVKLNNSRIISQSGAFFLFGVEYDNSKLYPASLLPKYEPTLYNIESDQKNSFIGFLESFDISIKKLFPDLEHHALFLRK